MALKKILIIAPHFPPSNLAGVHRSRLFAQHLPEFGWEPIILTVHHQYYEEQLDWHLAALLPPGLRIERVKALPVKPIRLVGDIGIRAFLPLLQKTIQLIRKEHIHFLYIPIPSNYVALIGRIAHEITGIAYGIDYIDPWVYPLPEGKKRLSKEGLSLLLARWLEPIAVRKAALITGVAEGYYQGVLMRNPQLHCVTAAMPYGGEPADHACLQQMGLQPYLFSKKEDKFQLVYAGAMLPKAYAPLKQVFATIQSHAELFQDVEFHFIGTGKHPNDREGYNIRPLAEDYGLWEKIVYEYPPRIPYLDVLVHLQAADGIFILGSTEPHYTPSKVYQAILSHKPVLAILHRRSTAVEIIRSSHAGWVLDFDGERDVQRIGNCFAACFQEFRKFVQQFRSDLVDFQIFDAYSARAVTAKLVEAIEQALTQMA